MNSEKDISLSQALRFQDCLLTYFCIITHGQRPESVVSLLDKVFTFRRNFLLSYLIFKRIYRRILWDPINGSSFRTEEKVIPESMELAFPFRQTVESYTSILRCESDL